MERPKLNEIPLDYVRQKNSEGGVAMITMSEGQWDTMLQGAYEAGFIVIELDENEKPIRAFQGEKSD